MDDEVDRGREVTQPMSLLLMCQHIGYIVDTNKTSGNHLFGRPHTSVKKQLARMTITAPGGDQQLIYSGSSGYICALTKVTLTTSHTWKMKIEIQKADGLRCSLYLKQGG